MKADATTIQEWLELLHGNSPGRVHICAKGNWNGNAYRDLHQAAGYAAAQDRREGVYLRCTTLRDDTAEAGRGLADDSLALPGLWADLDLAGPGHKVASSSLPLLPDLEAARAVVAHLPEPTLWVHSGGGLYPWWLLEEPHVITADLAEVQALSTAWHDSITRAAEAAGFHVGGTGDLARVLRIPGTINRKAGLERACEVIERGGRRYSLDELRAALPTPATKPVDVVDPAASASIWDTPAFSKPDSGPGPFDALAEHAEWRDLLLPAGYTHVGDDSEGRELWLRPDSDSEYSLKAGNHVAVVWSTDAGLPSGAGRKLTHGRLFAHLHHGGDQSAAARDLLDAAHDRPGASSAARSLPSAVLEAIRATGSTVTTAEKDVPDTATSPAEGEPAPGATWGTVDLSTVVSGLLSGTIERLAPTIGQREGGGALFYAGKINGVAGASGSGKSWTALATCCQEIAAGRAVVYIDLEDDEVGIVGRLLDLGASPADVLARFHYVRPDESYNYAARQQMLTLVEAMQPSLVVIDSTGEGMALDGAKPNDDDDTARWFKSLPGPIAKRGPAVLVLDHVVKADDGGLWPIGSQRKRAAISGAQYMQLTVRPFARGQNGAAKLICAKDRHGAYKTGEKVAELVVDSDGSRVSYALTAPVTNAAAPLPFRPTALMERVSRFLEAAEAPCSGTTLTARVAGNRKGLLDALDILKTEGYVAVEVGPRRAELSTSVRPYRQASDPRSDVYSRGGERVEPGNGRPEALGPVPTRSFLKEKERGTGEIRPCDSFPGTSEERVGNESGDGPEECVLCGQELLFRRPDRDTCDKCRLLNKVAS